MRLGRGGLKPLLREQEREGMVSAAAKGKQLAEEKKTELKEERRREREVAKEKRAAGE
jgi:hypothetical protein